MSLMMTGSGSVCPPWHNKWG